MIKCALKYVWGHSPDRIGILKCFLSLQIELEFWNVFWGEGKTVVHEEKPIGTRTRTNNKLNLQMTPGLYWWGASALITVPSLHALPHGHWTIFRDSQFALITYHIQGSTGQASACSWHSLGCLECSGRYDDNSPPGPLCTYTGGMLLSFCRQTSSTLPCFLGLCIFFHLLCRMEGWV